MFQRLNISMNKDTFCVMPWIGTNIDSTGNLSPCCAYSIGHDALNLNPGTMGKFSHSNFKQWKSWWLEPVRQELLDGQRHLGCRRCWEQEDLGQTSERQMANEKFQSQVSLDNSDELHHLSIAFGNTCNLRCIMCDPWSSSSWQTEVTQHPRLQLFRNSIKNSNQNFEYFDGDDFKNLTPNLLKNLKILRLIGGEPLFSPAAIQFLENIPNPESVTLEIITNATRIKDSVFDLLSRFKALNIGVSLEGVGVHNEYLRYGCEWSDIDTNIKRLKGLSNLDGFVILHVFQHTSYYSLIPLLHYCHNNQFELRIQTAKYYSYLTINSLNQQEHDDFDWQLRQANIAIGEWSDAMITDLLYMLDTEWKFDLEDRKKFFEYVRAVDNVRKITFEQAFGVAPKV